MNFGISKISSYVITIGYFIHVYGYFSTHEIKKIIVTASVL